MSKRDSMAKRMSTTFALPTSVIDFRGSWPVMPAGQGRPMSTYMPPQVVSGKNANALERIDSVDSVEAYKNGGSIFVEESEEDQVLGSTELYDKDGNLRLVPVCITLPPRVYALGTDSLHFRPQLPIPKVCVLLLCPL